MNLNRSNGQKKILINGNILTNTSLIISYLLLQTQQKENVYLSLSLSLSTFGVQSLCLSVCLRLTLHSSSTTVPGCRQKFKKKKKTNRINVLGVLCFYCEYKSLLHHFSKKKKKKKTKPNCGCVWVLCFLGHHYFSS